MLLTSQPYHGSDLLFYFYIWRCVLSCTYMIVPVETKASCQLYSFSALHLFVCVCVIGSCCVAWMALNSYSLSASWVMELKVHASTPVPTLFSETESLSKSGAQGLARLADQKTLGSRLYVLHLQNLQLESYSTMSG